MDGVLEELVDEGGQGGCRVLGDDRPSEDKFKIPIEKHPTFFVRSSSLLPPFTSERQRNEKMSFGGHSEKNDWQTIPSAFFHSIIVQSVPSSFYIEVA